MKNKITLKSQFVKTAMCVALAFSASASHATPIVLNNAGFEASSIGTNYHYLSDRTFDGWYFAGNAGLAGNNSGFNVANAAGNSAAFLQQGGSSISQEFTFAGGYLSIDFLAESRSGYGGNLIQVAINDQLLTFNGVNSILPSTSSTFSQYQTDFIGLAAGNYTLKFIGTDSSRDVTTFIDNVAINAVPEPGSLALFAVGALAAAGLRRRRRA